ncbi:hypothetical protein [Natronomonas sp. EA1]
MSSYIRLGRDKERRFDEIKAELTEVLDREPNDTEVLAVLMDLYQRGS